MSYLDETTGFLEESDDLNIEDILSEYTFDELSSSAAEEASAPSRRARHTAAEHEAAETKSSSKKKLSLPKLPTLGKKSGLLDKVLPKKRHDDLLDEEYLTEDPAAEDPVEYTGKSFDFGTPDYTFEPVSAKKDSFSASLDSDNTEDSSYSGMLSDLDSFIESFYNGDYLTEDYADSDALRDATVPDVSDMDYLDYNFDTADAFSAPGNGDEEEDALPPMNTIEEDYVPPKTEEFISSYAPEKDPAYLRRPAKKKSGLLDKMVGTVSSKIRRKGDFEENYEEDFFEEEAPAPRKIGTTTIDDDFEDWDTVNANAEFAASRTGVPSDFKEYLASIYMTFLYKLRGAASAVLTMEDRQEELGPEVSPKKASAYYGKSLSPIGVRLKVCGVMLLIMAWISLGLPVSGMLKTGKVASAVMMGMQFGIMLLCLDVGTNAVVNAISGKFGLDFMAVLACVVTSLDAMLVSMSSVPNEHLALCFLSALSLTGVLLSSYITSKALRKAIRVPAIGQKIYTVSCEQDLHIHEASMLKAEGTTDGFVRRSEEISPDENMFSKLALPLMAVSFLLGVISALAKHDARDLIYFISIYACASVPFCGLFLFGLPYLFGTYRIFKHGSAIAGWSGVADMGHSQNIYITDRDLFPKGSIKLQQFRIISEGNPERYMSYTGSILKASGSSLAEPFLDYMEQKNIPECPLRNFEVVPGGGLKAVIDGRVILCGNRAFMYLMKVPVSADYVDENSVLVAVNGELSGIFNLEYNGSPEIRSALQELIRSDLHAVFVVRDFNITPKMLKDLFELATDGYDFPPYDERFDLTEDFARNEHNVTSVICCEGLRALVNTAQTGKSIFSATVTNLYIGVGGTLLTLLIAFFKLMIGGSISVPFLFVIALIMTLLVAVNSYLQKF